MPYDAISNLHLVILSLLLLFIATPVAPRIVSNQLQEHHQLSTSDVSSSSSLLDGSNSTERPEIAFYAPEIDSKSTSEMDPAATLSTPSSPTQPRDPPAHPPAPDRGELLAVVITPLPLLHSPELKKAAKNQSSINNLLGDEKDFLNEIVRNFNKSLTLVAPQPKDGPTSSLESSPTAGGATPNATAPSSTASISASATKATPKSLILASTNPKNMSRLHYHKSDSAMLNYIFDTHVKHRHSDLRFGPHFVEVNEADVSNVSVLSGATGLLSCKISQLQDKTVSWVRRMAETDEMTLLTVGPHTYSSDARFSVDFQYPDNWRLKISNVNKGDEGIYECQISTHPPQVFQINFFVSSPEVLIVDEQGLPLYEKFYNLDSLLQLECIVRHITMTTSVVFWLHGELSLNYDTTRGGTSVRTDLTDEGANSTLSVARLKQSDSGNYTCSIGPNLFFTTSVHVLNESLAELYHGRGVRAAEGSHLVTLLAVLWSSAYVVALSAQHITRIGI